MYISIILDSFWLLFNSFLNSNYYRQFILNTNILVYTHPVFSYSTSYGLSLNSLTQVDKMFNNNREAFNKDDTTTQQIRVLATFM